jgi:hypothetical protein
MGGATCSFNLFTILKVALAQRLGLGRFSSTSSPTCFARDYFKMHAVNQGKWAICCMHTIAK